MSSVFGQQVIIFGWPSSTSTPLRTTHKVAWHRAPASHVLYGVFWDFGQIRFYGFGICDRVRGHPLPHSHGQKASNLIFCRQRRICQERENLLNLQRLSEVHTVGVESPKHVANDPRWDLLLFLILVCVIQQQHTVARPLLIFSVLCSASNAESKQAAEWTTRDPGKVIHHNRKSRETRNSRSRYSC